MLMCVNFAIICLVYVIQKLINISFLAHTMKIKTCYILTENILLNLLQILSRQKPVGGGTYTGDKTKKKKIPKFEDFVEDRDYTGAITVLEVRFKFVIHTHGLLAIAGNGFL